MKLTTFISPSKISISPTDSSMLNPTRAGMTRPKRMMALPTAKIVSVCPMPQYTPTMAELARLRCRLTMVVTAMTWSGSVACRIPRKNPSAMMEKKLTIYDSGSSDSDFSDSESARRCRVNPATGAFLQDQSSGLK